LHFSFFILPFAFNLLLGDGPMNDPYNESFESQGDMSVGDRNVERLLRSAYDPVPVSDSFAERVRAAMHDAAAEHAASAKSDLQTASGVEMPPAAWKMAIAAAIALSVIVGLFSIAGPQGESRDKKVAIVARENSGSTRPEVRDESSKLAVAHRPAVSRLDTLLKARPKEAAAELVKLALGDSLITGKQERKRALLPDGSVVWLNEQTELRVTGPRRLSLAKGEAYFEVAPQSVAGTKFAEASSRFVVATPRRDVTALGTKFVVRVDPNETKVTVAQGKVAVGGVAEPLTVSEQWLARNLTALDDKGELERRGGVVASGAVERKTAPRISTVLSWTKELSADTSPTLVPASEHEGGALIAKAEDGQETRLSLRRYHIDVHIEDGFARTTIDQTYFNHLPNNQEGTFFFPLPADASISRLAMYVAGKLMEGGMAERQHAHEVFEAIKRKMQDPALLEWIDGTTFRMRVFPLEGRQEKRIVLSYTQRLPSLYGKATYRFPAGHNFSKVGLWTAAVHVKGSDGKTWRSPSHTFAPTTKDDILTLTTVAKEAGLQRDIVVELTDKSAAKDETAKNVDRTMNVSRADHELSRYYMLRQRPELPRTAKRERRDWIVLVETSADRDPLLARAQIEVARGVLAHVEHDDTFTILSAAAATNRLTEKMEPATVDNVRNAIARLEDTQLLGALDLGSTLAGLKPIAAECGNPYLVHIGSGYSALGSQDQAQLVAALPEKTKYIGVGVGKRWNRAFMKQAAAKSGGYFTQINPDEDIAWRSLDLVATLNTQRLLDVKVTDNTGRVWLAYDDTVADGEEVCAITRLDSAAATKALGPDAKVDPEPTTVTISGSLDGKPFEATYPIEGVADNANYLPRMWAKLEIDRLLAEDPEAHKERITTLSKAMYVMSPFTSLLVLENDAMYTQYNVDRGRKDHWAMYPCPENIPVVREPLETIASTTTTDTPVAAAVTEDEKRLADLKTKTETTLGTLAVQPRFLASYLNGSAWNGRYWTRGGYGFATGTAEIDGLTVLRTDNFTTTFGRPMRYARPQVPGQSTPRGFRSILAGGVPGGATRFNAARLGQLGDPYEDMPLQFDAGFESFGEIYQHSRGFGWGSPQLGTTAFQLESELALAQQLGLPITGPAVVHWDDLDLRPKQNSSDGLTRSYLKQWNRDDLSSLQGLADGTQLHFYRQLDRFDDRKYYFAAPQLQLDAFQGQPLAFGANAEYLKRPGQVDRLRVLNMNAGRPVRLSARGVEPMFSYMDLYDPMPAPVVIDGMLVDRFDGAARFGDEFALMDFDVDYAMPMQNAWITAGVPFGNGIDFNVNGVIDGRWIEYDGTTRLERRAADWRFRGRSPAINESLGEGLIGPVRIEYNESLDKLIIAANDQDIEATLEMIRDWDRQTLPSVEQLVRRRRLGERVEREEEALREKQIAEIQKLSEPNVPGEPLNLLYEHPNLAQIPLLVHTAQSLASYAPGMYSTAADAQAVLEEEVAEHRPKLGKIDDDARKMIDRARSRGWQEVTIPLAAPFKPLVVHVDGAGRHRYTRYTSYGLGEEIISDGQHEWRLYAELGLGAKRKVSRYHRAGIEQLVPWLVPTVEDLAIGGDVVRVDDRTVSVVRTVEWEVVKIELDKIAAAYDAADKAAEDLSEGEHRAEVAGKPVAGAEIAKASKATIDTEKLLKDAEREKRTTKYEMRMVFVDGVGLDGGRLSQRQWLVDGKVLLRVTYGPTGSIVWSDGEGKNLAEQMLETRSIPQQSVSPDTKSLVVLPLPWRRWGTGPTAKLNQEKGLDYVTYTDDEAMHALAAFLAGNDASAVQDLIARRYFASPEQLRGKKTASDRRLGFYTLLCLVGCNWQPDSMLSLGGSVEQKIPASVLADHPNSPIAWLLAKELADRKIGHPEPPAMPDGSIVAGDKAGRSLAATLITLRRLYRSDDPATAVSETAPDQVAAHFLTNWQLANAFAHNTRSPVLAAAVLKTMQTTSASSASAWTDVALGYERWGKNPGLASLARYEAARAWFKSGDRRKAQEGFSSWYEESTTAGIVPLVDHDFRQAFYGDNETAQLGSTPTDNAFTRKLLDAAKKFTTDGVPSAALVVAWQAYQLGQPALGDEIVNRTLASLDEEQAKGVKFAAIRVLYHAGKYDRADALLTPMLEDKHFAEYVSLWRLGADLSEKRQRLAESVARWEKVAELEYSRLGDSYEVATAREPFESLMQRYEKLATAIAATSQPATSELIANVVRAADRWRTLDADPTAACLSAAKILTTLGKEDLAWAYATTPLATAAAAPPAGTSGAPGSSSPYAMLARQLADRGEVALATRAYIAAAMAEPKDAQVLWDYAQLLERHAKFADARAIYERLSSGEWSAENLELKRQAGERVSGDVREASPTP
jgi:hypothetical protein